MCNYADDLLLYHPIQSPEDYRKLQGDIDRLQAWSETNVLLFNQSKSKYMKIQPTTSQYVSQYQWTPPT